MDATRGRRTRDCARQRWYAYWRSLRFARHLGFTPRTAPPSPTPSSILGVDLGMPHQQAELHYVLP